MKTNTRRSLLQIAILLQLERQSAKTITELAERLTAQRPSVTRSLRGLRDQGLVCRGHGGWRLTDAGKAEVMASKAALARMGDQVQTLARRTADIYGRIGLDEAVIEIATKHMHTSAKFTSAV